MVVTSRSLERAKDSAREIEGLGGCALGCAFSLLWLCGKAYPHLAATNGEYQALFEAAGYQLRGVQATDTPFSVCEGVPL